MLVGTIGSSRRANLDGGGSLTVHGGTQDEITIGWWVGAEDRWHRPEREITVRQSAVQGSPVTMTALRIPGGDATLTVYGAIQGPRELVVLDLADRGRAPIVWALTISGRGVRNVSVDGSTVRVDGFGLLTLPRSPMRSARASSLEELAQLVMTGGASEGYAHLKSESSGGAGAFAFLVPVSQSAAARAAVLIGGSSALAIAGSPVLGSLPDVHTAASGWRMHLGRGPRLVAPDRESVDRLQSAIGGALLAAEPLIASSESVLDRVVSARAFDSIGLSAEAGALLEGIDEYQRSNGLIDQGTTRGVADDSPAITAWAVDALCHHAWLTQDSVFAETLSPVVVGAVEALLKGAKKNAALLPLLASIAGVEHMLTVAGDPRAAKQAKAMWVRAGSPWSLPAVPLPPLPAFSAGGTLVPNDPLRLAGFIRQSVGVAAEVLPGGVVDLVPGFARSWAGSSFEIRNLAVPGGTVSVVARWHGARPALLWEVHGGAEVTLSCRSIDPSWSTTMAKGEALLEAPTFG